MFLKFNLMPYKILKYFILGAVSFFVCCHPSTDNDTATISTKKKDSNIKYAKRFAISRSKNGTFIYLFGNKTNFDTTATYLIYNDPAVIKNIPKTIIPVKSPCKRIAALSSIYANMFCELGLINNIVAIDNGDYFNNPNIIERLHSNQLLELAKGIELDLEQTIKLNPDIVFTFGMGDPKKDVNPKLILTNIPVAISLDHAEETPLARAEWIKFFAAFVNKNEMADSIFKQVEKKYNELQSLAQKTKTKPTVFTDIKYSDSWYIPGGKSYLAKFLTDAGANYIWKEDLNTGSVPLNFEQVYAKAKNADFWINPSLLKTKKELLGFDSRYIEFNAFKTGAIYNNTKVTNKKGYSTYWETGMIHPDRILHDLILIFHPEIKELIKNDLYYYEQLK